MNTHNPQQPPMMHWCNFTYDDHTLGITRRDRRKPTMHDLQLLKQWQEYLYAKAYNKRHNQ